VRECESNWWAARRPRVSGCVEVLQVEVGGSVFNLIGFVVSSLKFGVQGFGPWFWVWGLRFGVWYLPELLHDEQVFPRLRIVPLNLGRGLQGSELRVEGSGTASSVEGKDENIPWEDVTTPL